MLENISKIMDSHTSKCDECNKVLKDHLKSINDTYKDYKIIEQKTKEARDIFNNTLQSDRDSAIKQAEEIFASARQSIADITSKPVPQDAISTIELLKSADPLTLSKFEIETILDRYKTSYLATKLIIQVTNADKKFEDVHFYSADGILAKMKEFEMAVIDYFRTYSGQDSLGFAVFRTRWFNEINTMVNDFVAPYSEN